MDNNNLRIPIDKHEVVEIIDFNRSLRDYYRDRAAKNAARVLPDDSQFDHDAWLKEITKPTKGGEW